MDKLLNTANELVQKLTAIAPDALTGLVAMQAATYGVSLQWAWVSGIGLLVLIAIAVLATKLDNNDEGPWSIVMICSLIVALVALAVFACTMISYSSKPIFEAAPQVYVIKALLSK